MVGRNFGHNFALTSLIAICVVDVQLLVDSPVNSLEDHCPLLVAPCELLSCDYFAMLPAELLIIEIPFLILSAHIEIDRPACLGLVEVELIHVDD